MAEDIGFYWDSGGDATGGEGKEAGEFGWICDSLGKY